MYLIIVATIPSTSTTSSFPTYNLGRDWLYDRKISSHERAAAEMAERVTNELAGEWLSGGWVDEHMRDQLVIFQALADGRSEVFAGEDEDGGLREPSLHARTAEWVARQMLGVRFDMHGVCEGVGFRSDGARESAELGGEGRAGDEPADGLAQQVDRLLIQ